VGRGEERKGKEREEKGRGRVARMGKSMIVRRISGVRRHSV
jgi:hypothetical protein